MYKIPRGITEKGAKRGKGATGGWSIKCVNLACTITIIRELEGILFILMLELSLKPMLGEKFNAVQMCVDVIPRGTS